VYDDEVWSLIREMREKGISVTDIVKQLGIDRKTVRRYMNSDKVPRPSQRNRKSKLNPVRPIIKMLIDKYNLSSVRILEEIWKWGYQGSSTILKEQCRTIRKERSIKAVYRFETEPGIQAQVDFGSFGTIEVDGRLRKLYCFSYVLGYSRMRYVEFITDISTQNLIRLHINDINAFRYTGGITSEILFDNMKQVVLERRKSVGESKFNSDFMSFSDHYGFTIRLCYPHCPQTKGKVENSIKFIRNNFFNGREFSSLQDINIQCSQWLEKVNSRVHGTTGRVPTELLNEEHLHPVDAIPEFIYTIKTERKVSRECFVHYNGNRYSFHWKHAGRVASVEEEGSTLKIKVGDDLYEHDILPGTGRISRKEEHFEGLLTAIKERNIHNYGIQVEKRDLKQYEVI
jgi:transposase